MFFYVFIIGILSSLSLPRLLGPKQNMYRVKELYVRIIIPFSYSRLTHMTRHANYGKLRQTTVLKSTKHRTCMYGNIHRRGNTVAHTELRSCVKVEVAVMGSQSLTVSVDVKPQ